MKAVHALAFFALAPVCIAQPDETYRPPAKGSAPAATPSIKLDTTPVAFPQYPTISPDGSLIVFSFAGDLWSVPTAGGVADRLTAHPSDEARSAFSPDGNSLAFESERDGPANLYIMPVIKSGSVLTGGTPRRITTYDKPQALSGFSPDGKFVLFSASLEPSIYRMSRMYRAPIDGPETGGAPIEKISDAFGAAPHPASDGTILFNRERFDATRPKYVGPAASDVYKLDPKSGAFTRLTFDPHSDGDAFTLPDGSVVYTSSRNGENNIFKLKAGADDKASPQQLTSFAVSGAGAGPDQTTIMHGIRDLNVTGWTAVFAVWDTLYTLDLKDANAKPRPVSLTASGDFAALDFQRISAGRQISETALSPDGKTLAVIARGEVFVRSTEKDRPTRHVTATGKPSPWGRCRDLNWSPDGRVLYFSSDTTGVSGIYAATVVLAREDLTSEDKPDRVPDPKPDQKAAEPEPAPGGAPDPTQPAKPKDAQPEPKAAEPEPAAKQPESKPEEKKPETKKKPDWGKRWADSVTFKVAPVLVSEKEHRRPIFSPDGKHMLISRDLGDLVLFSVDKDDPAKLSDGGKVIVKSWNDTDPQWAADSRHILYAVEDYWFNSDVWLMDALADGDAAKPINITRHPDFDHAPRLSYDGKVLFFLSDRDSFQNGQDDVFYVNLDRKLDGLRTYELADYFKEAADKVKKKFGASPAAAGGGAASGAAGGGARPGGARRGGGGGAPAAAATPAPEEKPADQPKEEEKKEEAKPAAKSDEPSPEKPLTFDSDDAFLRVRKLSGLPENIGNMTATPGGERVIFTASVDGTSSLLSVDYSGKDRKTVFAGPGSDLSVSLGGDRVLFTSGGAAPRGDTPAEGPPRQAGGQPYLGRPGGGEAEAMPIDAPLVVDIEAQQKQKFRDAARLMGQRFYHPTLKGLDWPALMSRYESIIIRTRTDTEFNRIFNNLLGELEGSHMGMSGGRSTQGDGQSLGYLGADLKRVAGGYQVTRIVPNGPADRKATKLNVGDVIVAINSKPLANGVDAQPRVDFASAMQGTSGQETLLEIRNGGGKTRNLLITPIAAGADTNLRYQDEVRQRKEMVDKLSDGKLGYLHIRAMDFGSVRDYERDLFAAADGKLGLIIDVRDNGGGSTTDVLLSSLTAPRHAYTASRGVDLKELPKDAYPRDRRPIYAYNREISVLCNQHSYSNAEIFSHSIKTIGRGKVVGTQTFGAVISTGAYGLIDGSNMRTPFRGWYLPDGTDMENHGCMPDIAVPQTPEDEVGGKDPQLEAAVKELLTRAKQP